MWRINNIMLSMVLAGIILFGLFAAITMISWKIEARNDQKAIIARTINAGDTLDDQGQKLRLHTVSYDTVISHETWGPWSLVPIQHTSLDEPVPLDESYSRDRSLNYSSNTNFSNNFVLRNQDTNVDIILFDQKVAVASYKRLHNHGMPGLAVAYADEDSNKDGKISPRDKLKVKYFKFSTDESINISVDQTFHGFEPYKTDQDSFHFTAFNDNNQNSELEENFETMTLYEVNIETGVVSNVLKTNTVTQLQSIIDGVNNSAPDN
jgi:hypothetical protein